MKLNEIITLEQATKNATEWEEAYTEARAKYLALKTEHPSDPTVWRKAFLEMTEAKGQLEWYYGYDETDAHGNRVHHGGAIQKLANEAQKLRERMNLGQRFMDRTFENFDNKRDPKAYTHCVSYAQDEELFSKKRNGLVLIGSVGSGKTHLAAAIANDFVERGIPAMFGTFQTHLENIRNEFDRTGEKKYLSEIKNVPVLVIDDLGKERKTEWTQSVLYDVVNYRYEHLLPIIFTTNFNMTDFANYVEHAVFSRLNEMCSEVQTSGSDYRNRG